MFRRFFCKHNYEKVTTASYYSHPLSCRPCEVMIVYMCTHCGKIKKVKV